MSIMGRLTPPVIGSSFIVYGVMDESANEIFHHRPKAPINERLKRYHKYSKFEMCNEKK